MKACIINALIALLIFGGHRAAFSVVEGNVKESEYDLPTYEFVDYITLPKPIRGPMPKVNRKLVGTSFDLKFTVNKKGKPENVRLVKLLSSYSDVERMTFASQAVVAVSKWRFNPAENAEGKPVAMKVIMPVKVMKYGQVYRAIASLDFDESKQAKLEPKDKIKN